MNLLQLDPMQTGLNPRSILRALWKRRLLIGTLWLQLITNVRFQSPPEMAISREGALLFQWDERQPAIPALPGQG